MNDVFDDLEIQLRRAVRERQRTRRSRSRLRPGRTAGVLVGLALCAALARVAVLALGPGGGSSDFLARAAAALRPQSGTVLYERWETTLGPEAGNPYLQHPVTFGPEQLWIAGDHPHRYRTVLQPRRDLARPHSGGGAGLVFDYGVSLSFTGPGIRFHGARIDVLTRLQRAIAGRPFEIGGSVELPAGRTQPGILLPTLSYLPSNELLRARVRVTIGPTLPGPHDQIIENGGDPVSALRTAIAEGRARKAGSTELSGRTVQRIDLILPQQLPADAPPPPPNHPVTHSDSYALVEPDSLRPLEIVFGAQTYRFLDYRYLPATPANLALTDIRAQHPGASVLDTLAARRR